MGVSLATDTTMGKVSGVTVPDACLVAVQESYCAAAAAASREIFPAPMASGVPDCSEAANASFGEDASVSRQLDMPLANERVGDRHPKLPSKVVIAGSCLAECGFLRSNRELPPTRRKLCRHLHDAFEHVGNRINRKSMISVSPLLLDAQ